MLKRNDMKYIDADKLIAEIERRQEQLRICCGDPVFSGKEKKDMIVAYEELERLRSIITSLQQEQPLTIKQVVEQCKKFGGNPEVIQREQPKKNKNCSVCPHCVDRKDQNGWHFKGCFGGPYKGKFIAEIEECPLQQEQAEEDLEKAAEDSWAVYEYRESPRGLYSTCYVDGFKAGAEWQQEQYECIPTEESYMRGFAQGAKEEREHLSHTMLTYAADVFSGKMLTEDISYSYRQELADYFRDLAKMAKEE